MKRDYRLYLKDILNSIEKIEIYTHNQTFDEFEKDLKTVDAVIRNFEIIGEAAKKIPDEIKLKHNDIQWKTIKSRLPEIKPLLEKMLEDIG